MKCQERGQIRWSDSTVDPVVDDRAYFLVRMVAPGMWPDLTGQERPERPWLNGKPRLILLSDAQAGNRPAVPGNCTFEFLKDKAIDPIRSKARRPTDGCS